jgi:hypothetical protein
MRAADPGGDESYDVSVIMRVVGRQRRVAGDMDGRLVTVHLIPAGVSDSAGAQTILGAIRKRLP